MRQLLRNGLIIGAAIIAFTAVSIAPAHALSVSGGCTASNGYSATGWVNFEYVPSASRDYITYFSWNINGQSGSTQNNVNIELKRDVTLGGDTTIYSWSTGSARNGSGSHTPPTTVSVPLNWTVYANFRFTFDRNNLPDVACTARTSSF